ncbi:hypothetical protein FH972_025496 [Carpinus fangiana]|uniref:serine C-palmitoyltransferase n=1 Tax=Carpinus fangiana TaxID=176857 RepID=A0A5N6L3S7_9ROSI|nr:hypothetical protein FH972_025496 [Carpinus fangiana]
MDLNAVQDVGTDLLENITTYFHKIPGSAIVLRYVRSSYQNDPFRSAIELFLFLFAVRYLLRPSYPVQKHKGFVELTEDEIDDMVNEWQPEPLVAPPTAIEEAELEKRPVIVGMTGPKSRLSTGRTVSNLATLNFYNFVANETLKEKAVQTLRQYGVGPCGPPGFYGTQDVHMKTEADVATHLGAPACIVYAQSFSTISSVIPAFSKRGDIIVADKAVNFAIRKGIQISRSSVRWYEHNDMEDLERVLQRVIKEQRGRPLTRRFIVTEGIFENIGDTVDLPAVIELKLKYKFRLILDETWSYGVLGRSGRGLTEEQHVDATLVDMIVGSLAGPLSAGGGFCAGSEDIVEHQRISSSAYTFSAALPAMLATTASETIQMLQEHPELIGQLRENTKALRAQLDPRSEWVNSTSVEGNPVQILVLKPEVVGSRKLSVHDQEVIMQEVVDEVSRRTNCDVRRTLTMHTVTGQWSADHASEEPARGSWCCSQRPGLAGDTGAQGVRDDWAEPERGREGGHDNSTCHHESRLAAPLTWRAETKRWQFGGGKMADVGRRFPSSLLLSCHCALRRCIPRSFSQLPRQLFSTESSTPHSLSAAFAFLANPDNQLSAHPRCCAARWPYVYDHNNTLHELELTCPGHAAHQQHHEKRDIVVVTATAAPVIVGLSIVYSPYNNDGSCKTAGEVKSDFEKIEGYSGVRIYGTDCGQVANVIAAAKPKSMSIFAGIYDISDIASEVSLLAQGFSGGWEGVTAVSIGNELVNSGKASVSQVVAAVNIARPLLRAAGFKGDVVTVDTFNTVIANPELCEASDFAAVNAHPFFDPTATAQNAGPWAKKTLADVKAACGGKKTVITEVGWPSAGNANGAAIPSEQNQKDAIASIKSTFSKDVTVFSAFNDLWKTNSAATFNTEQWWGIYGQSTQ